MNMTELCAALLARSGEYQYEGDTDTLEEFITSGMKYLDEMVAHPKSETFATATLSSGGTTAVFNHLRRLDSLKVIDSEGSDVTVNPIALKDLLEKYPNWTNSDEGAPYYWAPDGSIGTSTQQGFRFMPPADEDYTVRIAGCFYSSFSGDSGVETSWWGDNYPSLLIQAAQMAMAETLGRVEEVKKWEAILAKPLLRISSRTGALKRPLAALGQA